MQEVFQLCQLSAISSGKKSSCRMSHLQNVIVSEATIMTKKICRRTVNVYTHQFPVRFHNGVWNGCELGTTRRVWPVLSPDEWPPCRWHSVSPRRWTSVSDRKSVTASGSRTARRRKLFSSKLRSLPGDRFS